MERQEKRGAADFGVGVLDATTQGRLHGRIGEQSALVKPDQGGAPDIGVIPPKSVPASLEANPGVQSARPP